MPVIVYKTRYDYKNAVDDQYKGTPADLDYLTRYPDIARGVDDGVFTSGYDHYIRYGKSGGRTYDLTLNSKSVPVVTGNKKYWIIGGIILLVSLYLWNKYKK
jgi:hypothetical protein